MIIVIISSLLFEPLLKKQRHPVFLSVPTVSSTFECGSVTTFLSEWQNDVDGSITVWSMFHFDEAKTENEKNADSFQLAPSFVSSVCCV